MLNKLKKNKYQILELILIFIITLVYNLINPTFTGDEIWNYGFSYNISNGLIPYKDFNLVITPIYPLLGALFISIFGNTLLVFHIFNSIICTLIFYFMKKINSNIYYLGYILLLLNSYPSYNILCILLLYILIYLDTKKTNNYLIGIILGILFLTKQNIGIYLFIPSLITKDIKKIIKRIIGFLIPNLIILIYLIINNCLLEFIDYTILGLLSFAKNNITLNNIYLILLIIISIILIYKYINTKDITIVYILLFQLISIPLLDKYHFLIAIIPSISYLLNNIKINQKSHFITNKIPIIIFISHILIFMSLNIYTIYKDNKIYSNNKEVYKYRNISPTLLDSNKYIANYINNIDDELYIISQNSYLIKLEANIKINKYDLLNEGNLGSKTENDIINEIENNCSNKKCQFLLDENNIDYAKTITKHIKNKYQRYHIVANLVIYKNY